MNSLPTAVSKILEDLSIDGLVVTIREWRQSPGSDFAVYERKVRECLMSIERDAISVGLSALDVDLEELEIGGRRYLRPAEGKGRSICPMELRAGMIEGTWTPRAAEIMANAAAVMTPYEAAPFLAKFGGFKPSRSSLDRLPKHPSERWESNRENWEDILRSQETVHNDAATVSDFRDAHDRAPYRPATVRRS
jgi:hypothetical protein